MSLKGFETKLNVARVALFDQPKRIIFATGATEQFLGSEAICLGGKKILVVKLTIENTKELMHSMYEGVLLN